MIVLIVIISLLVFTFQSHNLNFDILQQQQNYLFIVEKLPLLNN